MFRWGNQLKERKRPAQSATTVQGLSQNEPQNQLTSLPMWTHASVPWSIYMASILLILAHDRKSLYLEIRLETQLMSDSKKKKKEKKEEKKKGRKEQARRKSSYEDPLSGRCYDRPLAPTTLAPFCSS